MGLSVSSSSHLKEISKKNKENIKDYKMIE